MGEPRREALRVGFDRSIKLEFLGAKASSDGSLVTYHTSCVSWRCLRT